MTALTPAGLPAAADTSTDTSPDYEKTLHVNAAPAALFDALTTPSGLSAWWTRATGSGDSGGELSFYFDPPKPLLMRVDEATHPTTVRWTVNDCWFLPDWVGTHPTFTITPLDDGSCELHFRHHGLTAALDCIEMCTLGWNHFLGSLRSFAETGRGMPVGSPEDNARRR